MTEEYQSRHERRSAQSKQKILDAAARVFAEQGYARASTKQIAEVADVAEGSLFYHFENKRGVLLALMDDLAEHVLDMFLDEHLDERVAPVAWLEQIIQRRIALVRQHRPLISALVQELILDEELRQTYKEKIIAPVTARIAERMQKLIADGALRPLNVEVITRTMMGGFLGFIWFAPEMLGDDRSAHEVATSVADFYWYGLRGEGREQ